MLPVVPQKPPPGGAPHASAGTHNEQFCLELGRPGLRQRKEPRPDPTARRMTLLESCNKFSLLIGSRVTSPFFRTASFACGKPLSQNSRDAGEQFTTKRFLRLCFVEKFSDYFFGLGFAAAAGGPARSVRRASPRALRCASRDGCFLPWLLPPCRGRLRILRAHQVHRSCEHARPAL